MSFLLPRSHQEFGSADYWDKFFKHRGAKAFEWYGEYPELCGVLHKYVKVKDNVLMIGCGNSVLSADLYDVGYRSITNIDISDAVIKQMNDKNKQKRPEMKFIKMDMMQMDFEDSSFSVVLDKGTLDAVLTDDSEEVLGSVDRMFSEISRVLRVGGRYVCISLAQSHILRKVLEYFIQEGWMIRVCRVPDPVKDTVQEFRMPVFAFVLTKFKKTPNMKQILEVAYFEDKIERVDSVEQLTDAVLEMQRYSAIRNQLNKRNVTGEQISLDLYTAASDSPRYTVHIVDCSRRCARKYGVFIVPEGRETDWMFATDEGRMQLIQSAECERLAVVTLHRDHTYQGLEEVKQELSAKVMELAPPNMPLSKNKQVPYLTIGDDLNQRTIHLRGKSDISGHFVVEDVIIDNNIVRRLIFLGNKTTVQSEARLVKEVTKKKGGKKKTKLSVNHNYFSHGYFSTMVAGLAFLGDFSVTFEKGFDILLIGVGGGGVPMFIHNNFTTARITAVELDPVVVKVAKEWFGYQEGERLRTEIGDGLKYVRDVAEKGTQKYQVVILDVDSKDLSLGMSCPAKEFVEPDFLKCIEAIIDTNGIFILNVVCRSQTLKDSLFATLNTIFKKVFVQNIKDDVNEIVFATPQGREDSDLTLGVNNSLPDSIQAALRKLAEAEKKQSSENAEDNDLCGALSSLKLIS